ncbi:MAG TPA: threonine synthase [Rhizomicrobium sp.]|nr:threonine synthase [Rhizomicrobium sp.]
MRYVSTRGQTPPQSFAEILLAGLAPDGGLYAPESWPEVTAEEIAGLTGRTYPDVAFTLLRRFTGDAFTDAELRADIDAAYATFEGGQVAPLSEIGKDRYLLELFHGPTLAFKDVAMQLLGRLFSRALGKRGGRATVVVATSGDTGSAAIAALGDLANIDVVVLYPHNRVSEVQRRQMTVTPFSNVTTIAVEGTFDDTQNMLKAFFADADFARAISLTAVNSINFARVAAQAVYYFTATAALGTPATFVVPTGNFGDVFAGEVATRMGLAVKKLVVATNSNDILARALNTGTYASGKAHPTLSPSMDIQVASNFERALYEASDHNTQWVREAMAGFAQTASLPLPPAVLSALRQRYAATDTSDAETLQTIADVHAKTGRLIDPHTAVAVAGARKSAGLEGPVVILSTADPAKFPDAVKQATGKTPPLPPRLAGLYDGVERVTVLPNDKTTIRDFILSRVAH